MPISLRLAGALFVALLALVALAPGASAQSRQPVTGTVADTTDTGIPGATVVLLSPSDSTIVSFAASRPDGAFRVRPVTPGKYILQITSVGYVSHVADVEVKGEALDVGQIVLRESVDELGQLMVRADRVPMVIRGDTLAFNASAFNVFAGANVEDLLRRLPGVEVESDGSITAQGQSVQRVTVDGREFFGSDPTVATRNLQADAVDQVEVFDKPSDNAEFTGVDDGQEQRTINLKLKEDRKVGYFGNISGGFGGDGTPDAGARYDGRTMINRFSPTTQISVIGNVNNINQQSFGVSDYVQFMGGFQNMRSSGGFNAGGISIGGGTDDGFTETTSGGLNLSHDFGTGTNIQSSYFLTRIGTEQVRQLLQQQAFGSTSASLVNDNSDQNTTSLGHRVNMRVQHELSDSHELQLRATGQLNTADLFSGGLRETRSADGIIEASSLTDAANDGHELASDANLTYRGKLPQGRSIVAELSGRVSDSDRNGTLDAENRFYRAGDLLTLEELDQIQNQAGTTVTNGQEVLLTQPLGRARAFQLSAERRLTREDLDQRVLDNLTGGAVLIDSLSNAYARTQQSLIAGLELSDNRDPYGLSVGVDVERATLDGDLITLNTTISRSYVNILPSAGIRYSISDSRNLDFRYQTSSREPSLRQLQPAVDNSNPLNLYVGNPDLQPEYQHNVNARYFSFDQFTSTNLFAFMRASYSPTSITTSRTVDEFRRQTSTPVNAGSSWSVFGSASFGTPIRPLGAKIDLSANSMFSTGTELINGDENDSRIVRTMVELSLENRRKDFFDVEAGARASINRATYSLNPQLDQSYINPSYYGSLGVTPGSDWSLETRLTVDRYAGGVLGGGQTIPRWQAEIKKSIMNKRARVELIMMDLLNQNVGVNYTTTSSYVQEERINSLGRYVLLRFVYNLSGGGNGGPGGGMRIMGPPPPP